MIKPWIFEFFPSLPGEAESFNPQLAAEYFNSYLELWPSAEPLGFEGIFFSEHHFGAAYSPSPNLLIAQVALRTRKLRLGVMGMVLPYHQPWRIVEEIGMLDHLTGGRLEVGTAAGIPQEMAMIGINVTEARERNDEGLEILDAALIQPVISHHGRYWNFDNLRLVPRPLQQPCPPKWTTVISVESARKAARRGSKICTGFHPNERVKEIFEAYREEAERAGRPAQPDQLALRRQVTVAPTESEARETSSVQNQAFRSFILADPRVSAPGREVFDTPSAHAFSIGDDEFIAGAPPGVVDQIISQCRDVGAGHFLAIVRGSSPEQIARSWGLFGNGVIPALKRVG